MSDYKSYWYKIPNITESQIDNLTSEYSHIAIRDIPNVPEYKDIFRYMKDTYRRCAFVNYDTALTGFVTPTYLFLLEIPVYLGYEFVWYKLFTESIWSSYELPYHVEMRKSIMYNYQQLVHKDDMPYMVSDIMSECYSLSKSILRHRTRKFKDPRQSDNPKYDRRNINSIQPMTTGDN